MKIGILSDSHDNVPLVRACITAFMEAGVDAIIHAGDIVAPFAAKELLTAAVPVRAVYGNNDGDRERLAEVLEGIQPGPREFTMGGKKFMLVHDRDAIADKDLSGIDILIYGHTHLYHKEPGPPLAINPGESGGWITGTPSAAILNTDTMQVSKIDLA